MDLLSRPNTAEDAFKAVLDHKKIRYAVQPTGIEVFEDLDLNLSWLTELPGNLHVRGSLNIGKSQIAGLPDGLRIERHFYMSKTRITALPASLYVGGMVDLSDSTIGHLPESYRVQGSLSLQHTPITALPPGLHVMGPLLLLGSRIQRLPPDLHVEGPILPPSCLIDLQRFMAAHVHPGAKGVQLSWPTSQHQRLEFRDQLQPYPDMLRVLMSLGHTYTLSLQRGGRDHVTPLIEVRTP